MSRLDDFLASDAGALARYRKRESRRVLVHINDIEPQSKRMSDLDRNKFQEAVGKQLAATKRGAFRADIALKLDLSTVSKNAPQAHTIAKNLLDLLSQRRPGVNFPQSHLLYKDDRQIQALSVSCRHGESHPGIYIEARPFQALLDDLELAAKLDLSTDTRVDDDYNRELEMEWVDTFSELTHDEANQRQALGSSLYDAYLKMVRWQAQKALLGRSGVNIPVMSWMYGLPKALPAGIGPGQWAQLLCGSKLRLQVGELPISPGESELFKQAVAKEISAFKKRWDWVISPLVVAVALQVVVRPNPKTPAAVLHDLDNIVRDYLLPGIVPAFGTVSDQRWTINFTELRQRDPTLAASWGPNPTPPPGTRAGVTRYEVWRLPAIANEPGFVSAALVSDMDFRGDLMSQIDRIVENRKNERFGYR